MTFMAASGEVVPCYFMCVITYDLHANHMVGCIGTLLLLSCTFSQSIIFIAYASFVEINIT